MKNLQTYTLGESEIHVQTSNADITYSYDQLYNAQETKSCFLFYTSMNTSFCIPKRVLTSDEERLFVKLCMTKVPKNNAGKRKWKGCLSGAALYIAIFFMLVILFRNLVPPR